MITIYKLSIVLFPAERAQCACSQTCTLDRSCQEGCAVEWSAADFYCNKTGSLLLPFLSLHSVKPNLIKEYFCLKRTCPPPALCCIYSLWKSRKSFSGESQCLVTQTASGHNSIQKTLLSITIITIKQKFFFARTSSATLNNVVKLNTLKTGGSITHKELLS